MSHCKAVFDTSNELLIQKWNNGVKLISPETLNTHNGTLPLDPDRTIKALFSLSLNVYFLKVDGVIQNINETAVNTCGFYSTLDAIGNSVRLVAKKDSADAIFRNNFEVLTENKMKIFDEEHLRMDDTLFQRISFKFPWFNKENKPVGIFGLSVSITDNAAQTLSEFLNHMNKLGLLASSDSGIIQKNYLRANQNNIVLSPREQECLRYLVHGKTAKGIANQMNLSTRTVENYINNIKLKFRVCYKADLIEAGFSYLGIDLN